MIRFTDALPKTRSGKIMRSCCVMSLAGGINRRCDHPGRFSSFSNCGTTRNEFSDLRLWPGRVCTTPWEKSTC